MKTKFKIKGFLPLLLSIALTTITIFFVIDFFTNSIDQDKIFVRLILLIFLLFTLTWLVLGEVKNKFIRVEFSDDKISVAKMGGLLPTKEFNPTEVEGWKYSILTSNGGNDEYLYLYLDGKKIIKVSEFYHKNYDEIKQYVKKRYKNLGFERFSYLDELKEMFE